MSWPKNDREAETRDATPDERAEHCFEETQDERKQAAKRVRRIQKGKGLGQEFDVKDEFFD